MRTMGDARSVLLAEEAIFGGRYALPYWENMLAHQAGQKTLSLAHRKILSFGLITTTGWLTREEKETDLPKEPAMPPLQLSELALGFSDALDLMEPRGDFITLPLVSRSPLLNIEGRPSGRMPRGRKKKEGGAPTS